MPDDEKKVIVKIDKIALEQFCKDNQLEYPRDHALLKSFGANHKFQRTEDWVRDLFDRVFKTAPGVYDRLKNDGLVRIKDIPTYTPCGKKGCGYKLPFGDKPYQCPGSDDEDDDLGSHHCVDCGNLCWVNKGNACDLCGDYWCVDYQNTFVFPEHEIPRDIPVDDCVCSKCFISTPKLWCTDPECYCYSKIEQVSRDWIEWNRRKMKLPPPPPETSKKRKTPE